MADCFSSFIVYVIVTVMFTVTQVFRDLASNLDCLLCAITTALSTPGTQCAAVIYGFVDSIMDLIDSLTEGVLGTIIKIIISFIAATVYLFSLQDNGQKFIDEVIFSIVFLFPLSNVNMCRLVILSNYSGNCLRTSESSSSISFSACLVSKRSLAYSARLSKVLVNSSKMPSIFSPNPILALDVKISRSVASPPLVGFLLSLRT